MLSHPNLSFHFPGLRTAMNSLKSYNYPDKNFDEGLKDLRVDDQLNLIPNLTHLILSHPNLTLHFPGLEQL
jgi:hypothetical protein